MVVCHRLGHLRGLPWLRPTTVAGSGAHGEGGSCWPWLGAGVGCGWRQLEAEEVTGARWHGGWEARWHGGMAGAAGESGPRGVVVRGGGGRRGTVAR